MTRVIESSGNIETICDANLLKVGDTVRLVFRALDDAEPPFSVKIVSPGAKVLLERVLRELPTGKPQSAPPISFTAGASGAYRIEIWQLYGKSRGQATLHVTEADTG